MSAISNSPSTKNLYQNGETTNNVKAAEQPSSAWSLAAYGAKLLPVQITASVASLGAAILLKKTTFETVATSYFPQACPISPLLLNIVSKPQVLLANYQLVLTGIANEEFLTKVLLQDVILKKMPQALLKKVAPHQLDKVNSKIAQAARVLISAVAFSAMHLPNQAALSMTDNVMNMQLANTFAVGLVGATLVEKTGNAWAALGLHVAFNIATITNVYMKCLI